MRSSTFTIADAIEVQTAQLMEWRTVLNDASFIALMQEVTKYNNAGYDDAYSVFRGGNLSEFVGNLAMQNARK